MAGPVQDKPGHDGKGWELAMTAPFTQGVVSQRLPLSWPATREEYLVMTALPELHGYHVHIYYDDATLPVAAKLRDALASNFPVQIGKNQGIAGPHPVPQMQVIFKTDAF